MGKSAGGFFGWLRGPAKTASSAKKAPAAKPAKASVLPPQPVSQQFVNSSQAAGNSSHGIRKDLLRLVLRETLTRNGIPTSWIGADILRTTVRGGRDTGIHVRLLIQHWDPRLLVHGVAFEQNFQKRVLAMDPLAANWLMGVSWQYAMADQSACPALPHPGSWTAMPSAPVAAAAVAAPAGGDVIVGPVTIQKPNAEAKADLERLLSVRDGAARKSDDFAVTQPIQL